MHMLSLSRKELGKPFQNALIILWYPREKDQDKSKFVSYWGKFHLISRHSNRFKVYPITKAQGPWQLWDHIADFNSTSCHLLGDSTQRKSWVFSLKACLKLNTLMSSRKVTVTGRLQENTWEMLTPWKAATQWLLSSKTRTSFPVQLRLLRRRTERSLQLRVALLFPTGGLQWTELMAASFLGSFSWASPTGRSSKQLSSRSSWSSISWAS